MFKVSDDNTITVFGFKTQFGGGLARGYGLIYDNVSFSKKYEPRYRLVRNGLASKKEGARKQRKEKKNRAKKFRGIRRMKGGAKKKKTTD